MMAAGAAHGHAAPTAVIALHYQNEVLHPDGKIKVGIAHDDPARAQLLQCAAALLDGARRLRLPIIHVRIAFQPGYANLVANCPIFRKTAELGAVLDGEWGARFYEALAPRQSSPLEAVVTHTRISAFVGTPLAELLAGFGARHLIIAGVATHSVVEGTVRDAVDRGYEVTVAADACHAADPLVHAASLASMRLLAEVGDVQTALAGITGEQA